MNLLIGLIIGLIVGYIISLLIERASWQNKRVCADAEDQLRTQVQGLESRNRQLESDYSTYEQSSVKLADTESQLRAKDSEMAKLQSNYEDKEKSLFNLQGRLKSVESGDLSGVNTKGWDWGKLAAVGGAGALAGYVAKDSKEYKDISANTTKLKAERDDLAKQLKAAKSDTSASDKMGAQLKTVEVERDNLKAKVGTLEGDNAKLSKQIGSLEADTSSADMSARVAELESERDGLKSRMGKIESGDMSTVDTKGWDLGKFGLAAGAGALAGYVASDDVDAISAERDDLAARLAAMEADTSSADMSARVSSLEGERDALQAKLDAASNDTALADAQAKNKSLSGERDALQAKLDAASKDTSLADAQAKNKSLTGERDALQAKLDAAAKDDSLAKLEAKYKALEGERDGVNSKLSTSTKQVGTLEARIAELEKQNKANVALAAAAAATAGGAGYFAGRDWTKLEVGTPELGNFSIDANDVATGKFTLSGRGEAGSDVAIQVGETAIGRTRIGKDSKWQYSEVIKIPAGVHEVWARMIDTNDGRTAQDAKSRSIKLQRRPAPAAPAKPDNLTKLWGIGPKFNELLQSKGIQTFVQLSKTDVELLRTIIKESDLKARLANEETWPVQAALAAKGDWDGLKALTADYAERRRSGEFGDD